MRYKRPVYIELPRDMVSLQVAPRQISPVYRETSDPHVLRESLREAEEIINAAQKPVIIAGVELHRFGLRDALLQFVEMTNIPVASTLLSKSVITERHPRYLGVYEGAICHEDVRAYVESSDCLILLGTFLDDTIVVVADTGDALFAAASELSIHSAIEFHAPAYYTSMGFAVPASIGIQLASPKLRPLVLVGDGAFQMTGMELATVARFNLNPIVVVLNNRGYGTERPMLDGAFNDLHLWQYSRIPEILGTGRGFIVETEEHLEEALTVSRKHTESFCILDVRLAPHDYSPALQHLTSMLARRMNSKL